jgi:hypothetical protein
MELPAQEIRRRRTSSNYASDLVIVRRSAAFDRVVLVFVSLSQPLQHSLARGRPSWPASRRQAVVSSLFQLDPVQGQEVQPERRRPLSRRSPWPFDFRPTVLLFHPTLSLFHRVRSFFRRRHSRVRRVPFCVGQLLQRLNLVFGRSKSSPQG